MNSESSNPIFKLILLFIKSQRIVFGGLSLLLFLSAYWLWLDYKDFVKEPLKFKISEQTFVIEKGTGVNKLAKKLEAQGVLKQPLYFKVFAYLNPELQQIKAGEYRLSPLVTARQLLQQLSDGKVIQYAFKIIEGQTKYQVLDNIRNQSNLAPLLETEINELSNILAIPTNNIEGWFFPDTYYFQKNEAALSILKRASRKMKSVLEREWQSRDSVVPYKNAYEALIMASIIEKETGIAAERAKIAGVFVRRLQKRMRLQTDPTIIYGIGPKFNGDITRKDMKTATAYNTYIINGLPPTPIAMPSEAAIIAALHPEPGESLYFVADGTGGHYFSANLAEHRQAVKRMLKRNKNKD
jgi:peptidoglycan lytic transglycosylase G